ncbi:MAG: PIN domain-containing protein [Nanoarchaeota archaeon]
MLFAKRHRIYIDTNFLLIPGRHKVDIFTGIERIIPKKGELVVFEESVRELEKIISSPTKKLADKNAAKLAILLIKQKSLKMVGGSAKNADELLISCARRGDYVATQDKELKKKLKEKGVRIIILRQETHIALEN